MNGLTFVSDSYIHTYIKRSVNILSLGLYCTTRKITTVSYSVQSRVDKTHQKYLGGGLPAVTSTSHDNIKL